ncbi:MAG: acetate--CoA ligase family protein [Thermodesulfobacteriota bacterium]|nr:acetate--CoA ligase family protein [Thermodesulfobacteriota bacterium]
MNKTQLSFKESRQILDKYGIPLPGTLVAEPGDVLEAAESEGYPIVLKALSPEIIHKTDAGAVVLNLKTEGDVLSALQELQKNIQTWGEVGFSGILVQHMADMGFELFIGAKQDPSFGPVTMIGHGGRLVELLADAAPGIGILKPEDVRQMLSKTMAGKIIDGFRGPPLDKEAIIDLTIRVSLLMVDHPEIIEIDLNPVIVYEKGFAVVDARLIKGHPVFNRKDTKISPEKLKNLKALFNAQSVAIVGASRPGTVGGIILKNCMGIEKVYPVNPRLKTVQGLTCYPALRDLPETPDVAVFAINPEATVEVFEEFCRLGGKSAVIFSDGFAESGRSDLENRLVDISRKYNAVYIGPNCMGVIDNFSGLNTLFLAEHRTASITEPSGIGFITQSGGVGVEVMEMLEADKQGLGKWVSCGNASSVGVVEVLAHMGEDPRIRIIAIYIEGLAEGLKLIEVGKKVTREKPVLVIKGGVGGGAAATLSHTASLAGNAVAFRACCRQAGFYLIEELTEDPKILVNTLSILATQPRAMGNRVGIVSVGGGAGILLADQITAEGMTLAPFASETRLQLRRLMERHIRVEKVEDREKILNQLGNNPLDLFGDCDDDRLLETLKIIDEDPNTDIILAAIYLQVPYLSEYLPERLVDLKKRMTKPLIVSPRGFCHYVARNREYLYSQKFHTYTVPMIKPMSLALTIWEDYKHLQWPLEWES